MITPAGTAIDNFGGSSSGGGVTSINTLTGAITLAAGTNITITPSGNTLTFAASGGGGGVVLPQRRSTFTADSSTTTLSVVGDLLNITAGGVVARLATTTRGAAVEWNAGGGGQFILTGNGVYVTGGHLKLFVDEYETTTGDNASYIALVESSVSTGFLAQNPTPSAFGISAAGFRCWNATGGISPNLETTWHAFSSNPSGDTFVDTGITQDTVGHSFHVIFDDDNSQMLYYIDRVLKATITTNYPVPSTIMKIFVTNRNSGSPQNTGISTIEIYSDL